MVDLGRGLAAADDRHRFQSEQIVTSIQVVGCMECDGPVAVEGFGRHRAPRARADAQDEVAGAVGLESVGGSGRDPVDGLGPRGLAVDVDHLSPPPQACDVFGRPSAVRVIFDAQRLEVLPDVELIQATDLLEVGQERIR